MNYMSSALNPGKKLIIEVGGAKFARYPVRTHFIESSDNLHDLVGKYILPAVQKSDIVVFCQKIVSILQKRLVKREEIKVGTWAKFLAKFVRKTPCGFSVGNPLKMQLAIELAGLPRILLAAALAALAKIFKIYGVFYRVAGHQISQIDGFYGEIFSQYADVGILGPRDCSKFCQELRLKYGFSFAVADVNDLGGNILGRSEDLKGKEKLLLQILKDNPATQANFQTPIIIIRPLL